MTTSDRDQNLRVRMNGDELRMLQEVADSTGQTMSEWVRLTVRQAHAALPQPPRRPKTPKPVA